LLLGLAILTALLLVQLGLYRVLERFADDPLADARIAFARTTIEAALAFFPVGSGMGTFTIVYPTFEKTPDLMANTFANHAHNDILELWLEAGLPGAVVAALCSIWILRRTLRVWRAANWGTRSVDLLLARAASMTLVAFCCALLTPPAGHTHLDGEPTESDAVRYEPGMRRVPATSEPGPVGSPALGGERWGKGIEWPDAWRKPSGGTGTGSRGRGSGDENAT